MPTERSLQSARTEVSGYCDLVERDRVAGVFVDECQRAPQRLWRTACVGGRFRIERRVGKTRQDGTTDQPAQLPASQWRSRQHQAITDRTLHVPEGLGPVASGCGCDGPRKVDIDCCAID